MRLRLFHSVSLILSIVSLSALILPVMSVAEETLHLYGPGGPYPAMQEAAAVFGKRYKAEMEIVVGPTNEWVEKAKSDADVIYSGSEYMIYRDCGIALTPRGKRKALARNLIEFLESAEGAKIFEKWGWVTETK